MRLTPWEEERLLVYAAAELARRHRDRGLLLNAPETVALISDAMFEAARGGSAYLEVVAAGRSAVQSDDVLPGVRELVDEVRLEVLMGDGTRLVVLRDPLGGDGRPSLADGPGAIRPRPAHPAGGGATPAGNGIELAVRSESRRVIRVSSHYPFEKVNARLVFDRDAARGYRLDLPAGVSERWAPGETRSVRLVRYSGDAATTES
jgi:urease subunit gamma/beta